LFNTGSAIFSPSDLLNLAVWYDATDLTTVLKPDGTPCGSGDGVQTWKDKSGNGMHLTNQYGDRPVLAANIINGKPVVRFTAAGKLIGTQLKGKNGLGSASVSYFVVYQYRSLHRTYGVDVVFTLGTEFDTFSVSGNIGAGSTTNDFGLHNNQYIGQQLVTNKWTVTNLIYDSTNLVSAGYQNGIYLGQKAAAGGALPDITILGSWDASWVNGFSSPYPEYFSDVDIVEVIIYKRALPASERFRVESYLNGKYGLTVQTPSMSPTFAPTLSCPSTYSYNANLQICYRYSATAMTWDAANSNCLGSNGKLMAASTSTRHNFIYNTIGGGNKNMWIGLHYSPNSGNWNW
jgi:hypothetical protein